MASTPPSPSPHEVTAATNFLIDIGHENRAILLSLANALLFMAVRPGLCAVRATCANPWSLADRSAAQSFQSEHVPLEAWPQGGARSRPRRLCSRDPQSFSGAPRSFRAWSCAEFRWARGAFNSVERLSLVREQVMNCLAATIFLCLRPPTASPAASHCRRALILHLYGRGLPTSCTFCDAVSRDAEQFEPA